VLRRLLLPLLLLSVLAAAPAALAKGVVSVKACGANGCHDVTGEIRETALAFQATGSPPPAGPVYRFDSVIGHGGEELDTVTTFMSADGTRIRIADEPTPTWYVLEGRQRTALLAAVRGLRPLPWKVLPSSPAPPTARVVESFTPATRAPVTSSGGSDATVALIAGLGAFVVLAALGTRMLRRRPARRPSAAA